MNKILRNKILEASRKAAAKKRRKIIDLAKAATVNSAPYLLPSCLSAFPYFPSSSTPVMPELHIHTCHSQFFDVRNQEIGFYRRYSGAGIESLSISESHLKPNISLSWQFQSQRQKVNSCCVYVRYTLLPLFRLPILPPRC